jgi:cation diffusion facilitator CzcD-associated flavoprotein CzcO
MLNIGVIGAGASGLVTIKELKDEGHQVTCFEKYSEEGGVFFYDKNKGGVYDSTMLTVSNYFMAFSSLAPDASEERRYWTGAEYTRYLKKFSEKFDLFKHIQFNTDVLSVQINALGKVEVVVEKNGIQHTHIFDSVAVCTGTHQIAKFPEFQDKYNFKGQILHSENYKNAQPFTGKKVVCIGMGESAGDIVHEIAQVAAECTLSIRQYPAVVPRHSKLLGKSPNETSDALISRSMLKLPLPKLMIFHKWFSKRLLKIDDNPVQRLLTEWRSKCKGFANIFLTKTEIFLQDIISNKLQVNFSGIKGLTETGIVFNDDKQVDADIIMCNTGYQDDFSFVKGVTINNVRDLFKHSIHPELGSKIVFIGWARPATGGVPVCSEMQSRYYALLCSGKRSLLPKDALYQMIAHDKKLETDRYHLSKNIPSLVIYSGYMDSLAKLIGCELPKFLWLTNPKLFIKVIFGSQIGCQYRLRGPHADPKVAKEVIMRLPTAWDYKSYTRLSVLLFVSKLLELFKIAKPETKYSLLVSLYEIDKNKYNSR